MGTQYNFDIQRGSTLSVLLTGVASNNVPYYLGGGYTVSCGMMSRYGASGYLTTGLYTTVVSGISGVFSLNMAATDTALLYVNRAVYDCKVTSGNFVAQTHLGYIYILPNVI
jgi:hypothetical protein